MTVKHTAATVSGSAAIACCVAFTPIWEGMDSVAKVDRIGTGHPITYCYGQTDEFGKVKVGQRFTKAECDAKLAESLPHYLALIEPCIHVDLADKTMASLLDASYNAGPRAVCRSPMVAKMNARHIKAGCEAFAGWYVSSDHVVRRGLIGRRTGIDSRKSERQLCLEGLSDGPQTVMTPQGETVRGVSRPWPKGDANKPVDEQARKPAPQPKPATPKAARPWYSWIFK